MPEQNPYTPEIMADTDEDKKILEAKELLKPKLTNEFLDTLVQSANTCNWSVDFIEVAYFVDWCFHVAGEPGPPLDVYNDEENNRRRIVRRNV